MKKSGFWTEFRQFIAKGNVMNLAVGVIIGAAFQAITTSLVNDIISPVIGLFASADMSDWSVAVGGAEIRYGAFLTAVINFLIMALVIFLLVKLLNRVMTIRKKAGTASSAHCQKMSVLLQRNPAGSDPLPALHL